MSAISKFLPQPPDNFSTQIASSSVSSTALTVQLDSVAGLPTEGVGQFFKKDASGEIIPGSIEYVHWTGVAGSSITFTNTGDRGITGSDSGAQSYVADDYFEVWVSSYYQPTTGILVEHEADGTHDPALVAMLAGSQTITGVKTFSASPIVPTPTTDTEAASKAYVDANSGGNWRNYTAVTPTSGTLDDPSFELTFAGVDLTTTIYPGMRIKLTQGTEKFFIVTKMAFSTNTTMTLYGGTDYDLVSTGTTAITAFAYSSVKAPAGFPMNPDKWTVETTKTTDTSKASPVQNTWYYSDMGSVNISAPIGVWKVIGTIPFSVSKTAAAANIQIAFSSSSSSVSDNEMLRCVYGYNRHDGNVTIDKHINLTSKTTYYVIARTTTASVVDITIYPTLCGDLVISLISAYL